jgi:DNA-binding NarL/FixJ family response regulator
VSPKPREIEVLIVEDVPLMRETLRVHLIHDVRTAVYGEAESVEKAVEILEASRSKQGGDADVKNGGFPDVILLDMVFRTPGGQHLVKGPELVKKVQEMRISAGDVDTKILCLSLIIDPDLIIDVLNAGASGYIDKIQAVEGWVEAITLVHEGYYVFSPSISRQIMLAEKLTHINKVEFFTPKEIQLSDRAKEVAFLYFRAGLTAKEIADKLAITPNTVRYHIKRIRDSNYMVVALGRE